MLASGGKLGAIGRSDIDKLDTAVIVRLIILESREHDVGPRRALAFQMTCLWFSALMLSEAYS